MTVYIFYVISDRQVSRRIGRDLLSQAEGEIFHPHPECLALWAWPVSGSI